MSETTYGTRTTTTYKAWRIDRHDGTGRGHWDFDGPHGVGEYDTCDEYEIELPEGYTVEESNGGPRRICKDGRCGYTLAWGRPSRSRLIAIDYDRHYSPDAPSLDGVYARVVSVKSIA